MTPVEIWNDMDEKLIAILRGIKPDEVEEVITALIAAGFRAIEIPLNSPDPIYSIEIAAETANKLSAAPCLIGAGTVIRDEEVTAVAWAGGNLVVSPNINPAIVERAKAFGMFSAPGVYTATECLKAIEAGADCLKIFPASTLGPGGFAGLRAVLPSAVPLCAVGGVGAEDFVAYRKAGALAFGLGSSLYKPGDPHTLVGTRARAAIKAYREAKP